MAKKDALFEFIAAEVKAGQSAEAIAEEAWRRFGETVAVLVLDSTGFTRTTQKRGIAFFLTVIAQLRRIARREFERYGAVDWRAEADNLYASFPDVDHAVAAAMAIHEHLEAEPIWLDLDDPVGAKVGIGFGQLLRSEQEGHYGDEMNLASKLGEDTARRGETLLTAAAYEELNHPEAFEVEERLLEASGVRAPYFAIAPKA